MNSKWHVTAWEWPAAGSGGRRQSSPGSARCFLQWKLKTSVSESPDALGRQLPGSRHQLCAVSIPTPKDKQL